MMTNQEGRAFHNVPPRDTHDDIFGEIHDDIFGPTSIPEHRAQQSDATERHADIGLTMTNIYRDAYHRYGCINLKRTLPQTCLL